jgi:YbbR domain-containing protein
VKAVTLLAERLANNRIFLACFSALIAFLVWLYVANVENSEIPMLLSGITVNYEGAEELQENNEFIVTAMDTTSVTLNFFGRRSVISKLNRTNVSVSVDLATVRSVGEVTCVYSINLPENVKRSDVIVTGEPEFVVVKIERLVSREVPVRVKLDGTVAEGYISETPTSTPASITIYGPSDLVNSVDHAQANIVGDQLTKSQATRVTPTLMDEAGNTIDRQNIKLNSETVMIDQPIKLLKEVQLTVALIAGAGADIENAIVEILPATIQLKGEPSELANLNPIQIGTIDLTRVNGRVTESFAVPIPGGMEAMTELLTADVTVTIAGLSTTMRTATEFIVENAAQGYSVRVLNPMLSVVVRGSADEIELVKDEDIIIVCDVTDVASTLGNHTLGVEDITVTVNGFPRVGVVKNFRGITVAVSNEED